MVYLKENEVELGVYLKEEIELKTPSFSKYSVPLNS